MSDFIPLAGILAGIIIPLAVFLFITKKGKRETVLEIAKHLDDGKKVQELLAILKNEKRNPLITVEEV